MNLNSEHYLKVGHLKSIIGMPQKSEWTPLVIPELLLALHLMMAAASPQPSPRLSGGSKPSGCAAPLLVGKVR